MRRFLVKMPKKIKLVKAKICRGGLLLAYWKGERVALVPRYHPDAKPGDYLIEEIDLPHDHSLPRIIDPNETSLSIIREICEINDRPFFWITGIDPRDKEAIKIVGHDTLQKAIEYFIAFCTAGGTTAQYRRIFNDLIKGGVIDPASLVEFYMQTTDKVENLARNFSALEKGSEKKYNYNDKIYNVLVAFHRFIRTGEIPRKKGRKYQYRSKLDKLPKQEEVDLLCEALKSINPVYELVIKIYWYLNYEMYFKPSEAPMISMEGLLKLKLENLDLEHNGVSIITRSVNGPVFFTTVLPDELFEAIALLEKKTDMYIFRTKKGTPIDSGQLRRAIAKASEQLPRTIKSIDLR